MKKYYAAARGDVPVIEELDLGKLTNGTNYKFYNYGKRLLPKSAVFDSIEDAHIFIASRLKVQKERLQRDSLRIHERTVQYETFGAQLKRLNVPPEDAWSSALETSRPS